MNEAKGKAKMSFNMDLPPDVETRLQQEATRQGVPIADVALRLIEPGFLFPACFAQGSNVFPLA